MNPISEYIIIGLSLALFGALGAVWVQELRVKAAVSETKAAVAAKELLAEQITSLGKEAQRVKQVTELHRQAAVEETRSDYEARIQGVNTRHAAAVAALASERLRNATQVHTSSGAVPGDTRRESGEVDDGAGDNRLLGLVQRAEAQAVSLIECRAERLKLQRISP